MPRRPMKPVLRALVAALGPVERDVRRPGYLLDGSSSRRRVARVVARRRDAACACRRAAQRSGVDAELLELVGVGLVRLLAVRAEHAHEALREDADDRRAHEERLDAHVDQARDGAGGVVRVDRREHEVTRERRVDRDLDRLLVADLADHDDVRILAQEGAERAREGEPDLRR